MRLQFASHHADFVGGGELSLLQLMRSLHDKGEDVALVVSDQGWCAREAVAAGIPVVVLPMPGIGSPACLAALVSWYRYFRRQEGCDVLYANTSRAAFYAGLVGKCLRVPVVFHCRIAEKDRRLDWLIARLATRIIANSRITARRFSPHFADKLETIYNGIAMPEVTEHHPHPEIGAVPLLLCVARVSRWKRHDLVLDAFALLAQAIPDVHLAMLGGEDPFDRPWMEALKQRSMAMSCHDRIHWLGQRSDMPDWYRAADALVLASREEPFGRVVVEAMASGVPVVAAHAGGPAEIIEQGVSGMLVDGDTPAAWADALRQVLTHDSLRERLIDQGRRRAADFSLNRHVEAMQGMFARLMQEGR